MSEAVPPRKRFYQEASIVPSDNRYSVMLDGRPVKTRSGHPLSAPTKELGVEIAREWNSQKNVIEYDTMPLTTLLGNAIDFGWHSVSEQRSEILNYLSTDLLCYRAEGPDALVKRQCKIWDPYLHWFKSEFGVGLVSTTGIQAVQQPVEAVKAVETVLADCSPERLFALVRMTKLTGSALLALAGWKGFEDSETIFAASRVDEHFQEEKWGVDQEAKVRENDIRNEFFAVCRLLSFL